jgi:hypothetical protein
MTYPRMDKNDYPALPTVITNEDEFETVCEFITKLDIEIKQMEDELAKFKRYPLADEAKKAEEQLWLGKQKRILDLTNNRYDQLVQMLTDYLNKNPEFRYELTLAKMKEVLK